VRLDVQFEKLDSTVRSLTKAVERKLDAATQAVKETAEEGKQIARDTVNVDRGSLRSSIDYTLETSEREVIGKVIADSKHAIFVEYGTRGYPREFPPSETIIQWALRKGIDEVDASKIVWSIYQKGTKEHPFMRPTASKLKLKFARNLQKALKSR
jgi:HK97 gp10 family phage protein